MFVLKLTMLLTPAQINPKSFESRRNFLFLLGVDASHVYLRAWALGCFHISTQTPSTGLRHPAFNTAVFSYNIGPRKLSANEQFFVGTQTVVSLLHATQIILDICFITDHVAYASSNKLKIV